MLITILSIFAVIYLCCLLVEIRNGRKKNYVWLSIREYQEMKENMEFLDILERETQSTIEYEEAVFKFNTRMKGGA